MKRYLASAFTIVSCFIINGCASSFKSIDPRGAYYTNKLSDNNIEFSYQYDILRARGNKKYAKREDKKGIKVVAVKITNHTGSDLVLGENYHIFSGSRQIEPLDKKIVYQQLKQGVAIYLLYMPLIFTTLTTSSVNSFGQRTEKSTPIGLVIGPGITTGNMAVAGTANANFKIELATHTLANRKIADGETVHALIAFQDYTFNPLSIKLNPTK
jgi:hypothetical protein